MCPGEFKMRREYNFHFSLAVYHYPILSIPEKDWEEKVVDLSQLYWWRSPNFSSSFIPHGVGIRTILCKAKINAYQVGMKASKNCQSIKKNYELESKKFWHHRNWCIFFAIIFICNNSNLISCEKMVKKKKFDW